MKKDDIVIVAACRTAVGKATKGSLKHVRPEVMGSAVLKELLIRADNLDPSLIDDVILGCAFPEDTQGMNLARVTVLSAGWPDRVPGFTINRFCASGLESIAIAASKIACGAAEIVVAGGIENMSQIPMGGHMIYPNPALVESRPGAYLGMGATAENVADKYQVSRSSQDQFAFESHQKAAQAVDDGAFKSQIVDLTVQVQKTDSEGKFYYQDQLFNQDEGIRSDTTLEQLAKLKPVFRKNGTVTAGNASQTSDGAAGVILMTRSKAETLGLQILAIFEQYAVEGCSPEYMGMGPVVAVPKLLAQSGLTLDQIHLIELNEAFAAQSLACIRELKLDPEIVNVNGGAIALGHPLGCTGSVLTNKLIYELKARKKTYGIVTMCVGFGMGAAGLFRVD